MSFGLASSVFTPPITQSTVNIPRLFHYINCITELLCTARAVYFSANFTIITAYLPIRYREMT